MTENVYENVGSGRTKLKQTPQLQLSPIQVKEILEKMHTALTTGEPMSRIAEAKEMANGDGIEIIRFVFPIVVEVKVQVLEELKLPQFERGEEGLKEFLKYANHYSHEDEGVNKIFMKLRDIYMPKIPRPNPSSWKFTDMA